MGQKENDLFGAWGCSHCHDIVDRRKPCRDGQGQWEPSMVRLAFSHGIIRTQKELVKAGIIKW